MPTFDITVECGTCGIDLCKESSFTTDRNGNSITVNACKNCMSDAYNEGQESMYDEIDELKDRISVLENQLSEA